MSARVHSASVKSPNGSPRHSASAPSSVSSAAPAGSDRPLEALRVDLLGVDREPVAGAVADEQRRRRAAVAVGLEERPQVGDPHGERARGDLARDALPGGVQERVGGHRATRIEQQPGEDRALLRTGRRRAGRRPGNLDRAEHAELHEADLTAAARRRKRFVGRQ
jgi:hypothetical protein